MGRHAESKSTATKEICCEMLRVFLDFQIINTRVGPPLNVAIRSSNFLGGA